MWATLKSRPDICVSVSIAASQIAHNPTESVRMCVGIWKYLAVTVDEKKNALWTGSQKKMENLS